jgi:hypothetical protein
MDRVGAPDSVRRGFGQADKADLALGYELAQGPDRLLDRRRRVDSVLVAQVDVIGLQPPQ